jgi:predicted amino acid dehydrogenase
MLQIQSDPTGLMMPGVVRGFLAPQPSFMQSRQPATTLDNGATMATLVTGATGFVGSAVARALAVRGHALRLLVRPASDRRNLIGLDAEVVTGDLTDPDSLVRAAAGCR